MKKYHLPLGSFYTVLFLFIAGNSFCYGSADSIRNIFQQTSDPCERTLLYIDLSESFKRNNADSALHYAGLAYNVSSQCKEPELKGHSLLVIADAYDLSGNYVAAFKYALEARKILESAQSTGLLAACLHLLGRISFHQSETADGENKTPFYLDALEYYQQALELERSLNRQLGIINNSIEIGYVRFCLGKTDEAQAILDSALIMSLQVPADREYIHNVAKSSYNLSLIYISQDSIDAAIRSLSKAVSADSVLGNKEGLAGIRLAEMYLLKGDARTAASLAWKNYDTALLYGFRLRQKQAADVLYRALALENDFENAYRFLLIDKKLGDSLRNADHTRELTRLELNYEFEKKEKQQQDAHRKEVEKQNIIIYASLVVLFVILLIAVFIYRNYREKQKSNQKLQTAYDIIEEKNEDILGSIRYARRIQQAILPPSEMVEQILGEHFIFYQPKDVVSGDFYWVEKIPDGFAFAVVDCTGHGVPGAFMSIIGHNALHRVIHEFSITEAGAMLDKMNELVEETLRQRGTTDIRDGMDAALCVVREQNGKKILEYAGANNPLYLVRNNTLEEIKADKQPVGAYENKKPFTTHRVELNEPGRVYIFTDGFADQFGGDKGKKFMYKPFKQLLVSLADTSLKEQRLILEKRLEEWKGSFEQIDDVCVMGVHV